MLITMLRNHFHQGVEFPIYNNYDLPDEEARELIECGAAEVIGGKQQSDEAEAGDDDEAPKSRKRSKK